MRLHGNKLAVLMTVFALAGGGGVAWACNGAGNPGAYPGGTTGTTTTAAPATPTTTSRTW